MSKRVEVFILVVIAAVCCGALVWSLESTVVPMVARGAGPNGVLVTSGGWVAVLASALSASGFSIASVVAIAKNWVALMPKGIQKDALESAIDIGQLGLYRTLYLKSTDTAEKAKLREAAALVADTRFDEWFPLNSIATKV